MKGRARGELFLRQFIDLANLAPEEAVLEPGCGTGRMAEPLTRYLTGTYEGFDVVRDGDRVVPQEHPPAELSLPPRRCSQPLL